VIYLNTNWSKDVEVITLFVEDVNVSKKFYLEVFDRPIVYEDEACAIVDMGNIKLNLLVMRVSYKLIEPAAVARRESGSRFMFTIEVDDVDTISVELSKRGVVLLNGPIDRPWGRRTACFADPDGHCWEIAHELNG
jgi:lactoylglutathione lyase